MSEHPSDHRTTGNEGTQGPVVVSRNHLDTERVRIRDSREVRVQPSAGSSADVPQSTRLSLGCIVKKTLGRLALTVAVVCLPLLGLGLKKIVDSGRLWWSRHQVTQAAQKTAHQNPAASAAVILEALRASPDDPKVLRSWAAFLKSHHAPASDQISALRKIVDSAEATTADQADLACALLRGGQMADARKIIGSLPESELSTTAMLEARAALLDATGDRKGGDLLRREAWGRDTGNTESRFKLAVLQLGEFYEENRRQAVKELWTLAHGQDDTALKAAGVMAGHESLGRQQADELLSLMEKHPKAGLRDRFVALAGVLRTHPERREEIIAEEVKKSAAYGPEDLILLGIMLDQIRAYRAMLAVIPEQKALMNRDLCILRIKALSQSGNYSELQAMLASRHALPISQGHMSVLASHLDLVKGDPGNAMKSLTLALKHAMADGDAETVHRVAAMSEEQGWWDIAAECHQWMADSGKADPAESLQRLFRAASSKRDSALMLSAAERMAGVRKESIPAQTRVAYLRLLLGTQMETVPALITSLEAHQPGNSELATAGNCALFKAFLCYRYGDKDGVRQNISRISDWSLFPAGQRAVGATLLAFSGNETLAFELASALPSLALLSEEQQLWMVANGTAGGVN